MGAQPPNEKRMTAMNTEGDMGNLSGGEKLIGVPDNCQHNACAVVFDLEAAATMSDQEVRRHYPRFYGRCPDCG